MVSQKRGPGRSTPQKPKPSLTHGLMKFSLYLSTVELPRTPGEGRSGRCMKPLLPELREGLVSRDTFVK